MVHPNLQFLHFLVFSIKLQNCNLKLKRKSLKLNHQLTGAEAVVVVVVKAHDQTTLKGNNLPYHDLLQVEAPAAAISCRCLTS